MGRIRQAHLGARMEPSINKQETCTATCFLKIDCIYNQLLKAENLYITQEKNLKFVLNSNLHIEPVL